MTILEEAREFLEKTLDDYTTLLNRECVAILMTGFAESKLAEQHKMLDAHSPDPRELKP